MGRARPIGMGQMPPVASTPPTGDDDTLRLASSDGVFSRVPLPRAPGSPPPDGPAWGDLKGSSFARLPAVTVMSEQQFPLWFTVALPIGLAAVLGLTYLVQVTILGGDWSAGALAVGIAALAMALGTLMVWGGRYVRGRKALSTLGLALALAVVLVAGGGLALAEVTPLHAQQGQYFEQQHDWGAAIDEYALAGSDSPGATNIARIYVEWGEQFLAQQHYAQAVVRFEVVLTNYAQSGAPVVQANADLFQAYSAWVKVGGTDIPYANAIATITAYSASPACDATCKVSASATLAEAHYQYGRALVSAHRYADAITQFETVQSKYGSSPYATQAHTAAAQAYLAYGKQLLTASCPLAVPLYQKLASSYGDTAQGKQASAALAAPVTVTGTLTSFPTNPAPSIYLSSSIDPSSYYYSDDYTGKLNASSGVFTFSQVSQGPYYLNTQRIDGSAIQYSVFQDKTTGNPYQVQVGPLCTVNVGTLPYS